jgi:hypothetical protein
LRLIIEGSVDPRTAVGSKAQIAWHWRRVRCWGNFDWSTKMEMEMRTEQFCSLNAWSGTV